MSKKRDLQLVLQDILEEIDRIKRFIEKIDNWQDFYNNELVYYAVLKCLENIGEASKHIPEDKRKLTNIDWRKIAALRNILVHEYFGIDAEVVWDIVKNRIPELKEIVKELKNKI
ncbi:DUF86 domain-containing protein [Thermodesulfovibrio thiophilus]|uniref:HepT-like ribonuclease domain-containing protein n=1 Tax=Thermodesulfovibrio thiophilus TaxID=340095 RepID=UPI000408BE73|nr:DUF86 domain-containing protein [Thermodesulfovibrio thiophilus]